jgi:hypothetical protein
MQAYLSELEEFYKASIESPKSKYILELTFPLQKALSQQISVKPLLLLSSKEEQRLVNGIVEYSKKKLEKSKVANKKKTPVKHKEEVTLKLTADDYNLCMLNERHKNN